MQKIGIYAGTFDPIHAGHLSFARKALDAVRLHSIVFLVEPEPREKTPIATFDQRRQMVRLAIESEPAFELADPIDSQQFTFDATLPELCRRYGHNLWLLMGTDVYASLRSWPGLASAAKEIRFVVGVRDGVDDPKAITQIQETVIHLEHEFPHVASRYIRGDEALAALHVAPRVRDFAIRHKIYY